MLLYFLCTEVFRSARYDYSALAVCSTFLQYSSSLLYMFYRPHLAYCRVGRLLPVPPQLCTQHVSRQGATSFTLYWPLWTSWLAGYLTTTHLVRVSLLTWCVCVFDNWSHLVCVRERESTRLLVFSPGASIGHLVLSPSVSVCVGNWYIHPLYKYIGQLVLSLLVCRCVKPLVS